MARGITLSFATITCDRCSATRLMTQACPECGLRPRRAMKHNLTWSGDAKYL